ncbi:MAG TPA: FAD-linked oxidase C-terminal domain-containing protein, partial [Gammaproteobacteria bacterium]|nr:FAD-linked oxidase C-terminal domain-containing protein [Gammaproteobacteria bacterium]
YGPEKVVTAQWEHARERFSSIPGVGFQEGELLRFPLSEDQIAGMGDQVAIGVPNLKIFSAISRSTFNPTPTMGHIGFSPVIPMTGEAVIESHRVIGQTLADLDTTPAFMTMPVSYHSRTFIILIAFSIVDDPAINRKTREVFRRLIKVAAEHGWGEYRTHTAFMDDCAAVYSYNNHSLRRLHETLKDAIDPNGILSAGRYGIWPGHLRKN